MASNDSRRASYVLYKTLRLNVLFNTSTFGGNLLLSLVFTFLFRKMGYGDAVDYVFFLSVLSVGLWASEAIPPFAVGILVLSMLVLGFGTDYIFQHNKHDVAIYINTWTSNVIWLLLGGFFLAEAMKEAQLDRSLFVLSVKFFGTRPEGLLLGLMLTTALGSMIMSNTATAAMMISSVMPLIRVLGRESAFTKALLVGIPAAASLGGMGTIIGSAPNAIAVGALVETGVKITFLGWMLLGFPMALLMVYIFWSFLVKIHKIKQLNLDLSEIKIEEQKPDLFKKRVVLVVLLLTLALWLTESLHGIPLAATSVVPIVLLTLTQVITADQVRALPWEVLMLVAGGLALGIALNNVGLTQIVMDKINSLHLAVFIVAVIFVWVAILLSNVMSNTAAASILVPLAVSLTEPYGTTVALMIPLSCACALSLPVSTPPNAVAYATGYVEQREFMKGGKLLILIAPPIVFVVVMLWWFVFLKS
jgi:sodium-dependent dicarboxylate transporter 2/3/5